HVGVGLGKPREQPGKAQVVADGEPEPAHRSPVDQDHALAGGIDVGFAPALARGQVDVEQVELVVPRTDLALAVDYEPAVGDLAFIDQHRERADVNPDAVPPGGFAAAFEDF